MVRIDTPELNGEYQEYIQNEMKSLDIDWRLSGELIPEDIEYPIFRLYDIYNWHR
jgi:hypothetical protein